MGLYYESISMLDIELVNFSRIKSGMGVDRVYIDFRNYDERLFLLIGANGSGKSSTMRCFHPFAFNGGTGDDGSNSELIIPGMDGKKTIHYGLRDRTYEVVHIYTRKKDESISVKSYIKEDGVELNPSGSATYFKVIIEDLFDLKESFLSVLSIGNTVDGFVKYTAGERKSFAMKIFQELGEYSQFYKIASQKVRETKPLLTNVTAKLEQYRGYDQRDLLKMLKTAEKKIGELEESKEDAQVRCGSIDQELSTNKELKDTYDEKQKRMNDLFNLVSIKSNSTNCNRDVVSLENEIKQKEEEFTNHRITVSGTKQNIEAELQLKDSKSMTLQMLTETSRKMAMNIDINSLIELKAKLESEREGLNLTGIKRPMYNSQELITSSIYLNELKGMCIDLVTNIDHPEVIPEVLERFHKEENLDEILLRRYESISDTIDQITVLDVNHTRKALKTMIKRPISHNSCENTDGCPFVEFYHRVMDILSKTDSELESDLEKRQDELNLTRDLYEVSTTLRKLYHYITDHEKAFQLPDEIFDRNNFINVYMENREVCDQRLLMRITDLVERFERRDNLDEEIENVTQKITTLEQSRDAYHDINNQITKIQTELSDCDHHLDFYNSNLEYQIESMDRCESDLENLRKQLQVVQDVTDMRLEIKVLKEELSTMDVRMNRVRDLLDERSFIMNKIKDYNDELVRIRNEVQRIDHILTTMNELETEQAHLSRLLEYRTAIQRAVSPTKGIPVEFINDFMKGDVLYSVNHLLDTVYHGKLRIDVVGTVINDTEFTIPYIWNGHHVADISGASDGQKAILTLVFSITLIKMTMGQYNIMMLDEMDTTLDSHSRAKFIELLENFAEEIKASQIFTISHNQMFDGHRVVVLLTSDEVVSNLPSNNIIRIYEDK